jgi:hypothetical protein
MDGKQKKAQLGERKSPIRTNMRFWHRALVAR